MQKKINKYIFILMLIGAAAFFLFLVDLIYTLTLEDAKKNHQLLQLEMSRAAGEGTRYFLNHLVKDMELLAAAPESPRKDNPLFRKFVDRFRTNYDKTILSSILIFNRDRRLEYVSGKTPPGWVDVELTKLLPHSSENSSYAFTVSGVNPDFPGDYNSARSFLLILRLNNSAGSVGFLVNFDSLIEHFILPLKLGNNDFVWILDGSGRLIYHPKHQEMLFNSIFDVKEECSDCHKSFDDQKKLVQSKGPGYGEYKVGADEPSKIFAWYPLQLENQRWNIAISTLLPDVVAGLEGRFRLFFILGVIILLTLLSFLFIIYYLNLRRIKSEEEKKNLETIRDYQEQLNHSSKLASLGELVDSVAHELNTPMGIISAHTDSLLLKDPHDPELREALEIIKKQTRRVSDYTKTILNFSKRMPFEPEELNICTLINESIYILNPRMREKRINVITEFRSENAFIKGDKRQLEQVFINIFNNAIDALEKNGTISIETDKVKIVRDKLFRRGDNGCFRVTISDDGPGIQKEHLDKIFEPFFTTRPSGTGLGLSIVRTIIQRHKGTVEAESSPGHGTTFRLTFPIIEKMKNE